ncbi:MAG: HIT family protein [Deltaproteobacteria bacterium]|nr:HIT family protein [Deltaproteobacteria bacterium]
MASVFTQIMKGEIPGHFVWEDDDCVALLTIQPIRPGHVLVIPREEINHWDDVPPAIAGHLMQVAQKVAKAVKRAYPAKRVGLMIAGLEVPHTHLHVMPIDDMSDFDFRKASSPTAEELSEVAELIRKALDELS